MQEQTDAALLRTAWEQTEAGDVDAALDSMQRAAAAGADPLAHNSTLANWLIHQCRWREALEVLEKILVDHPLNWPVHLNRARCLRELNLWEQAADAYRTTLRLNINLPLAWINLGYCNTIMHRYADAMACHHRAALLGPNDPEARRAYGNVLYLWGEDEAAETEARAALKLDGKDLMCQMMLGSILLRSGRWQEGWRYFEARHLSRPFGAPWNWKPNPRHWCGKPEELAGKRVLLRCEQGYGDCIQFARYVRPVVEVAESVTLLTLPGLMRLFGGLVGDPLTCSGGRCREQRSCQHDPCRARQQTLHPWPDEPEGEFDIDTTLMTLACVFESRPDSVPPPARFDVDVDRVGARIGLCFAGGSRPNDAAAHFDDQRRSVPAELFEPIMRMFPRQCIVLQEDDLSVRYGVTDWLDTARIIAGLDLVITVDTAIAHLAGSLGVETWLLSRLGGCWRWLSEGERTAWYPGMRIYRQRLMLEWRPTMEQVMADLKVWNQGRGA